MAVNKLRWLRRIAIVSMIIPLLIFLAFIGAMTFIDFNQYKPQIEAEVEQRTGHSLQIKGSLDIKIMPFSLNLQEIVLKNHPDFGEGNLLTLENARIQISLWDLFVNQNVKVTGLKVNNPKLYLSVLPTGKTNWQAFEQFTHKGLASNSPVLEEHGFKKVSYKEVNTVSQTEELSTAVPSWLLESLAVTQGEVILNNQVSKQHVVLKNIELQAFDVQLDKTFNLALKFDYNNLKKPQNLKFDLTTDLTVNENLSNWLFTDWQGVMNVKLAEPLKASPIEVALEGQGLSFNFYSQTIGIKQAKFNMLEAKVLLNAQGVLGSEFFIEGNMEAEAFNFVNWQKHIATKDFQFFDKSALNDLSANFQFTVDNMGYSLNEIILKIDESHFTGNLWKKGGDYPEYYFNIEVDSLNLDRYAIRTKIKTTRNQDIKSKNVEAQGVEAQENNEIQQAYRLTEPYLPLALPINTLRELNAKGQIKISELQAWQLKSSDFETSLSAHQGKLDFAPLDASFYQGILRSRLSLDVTQNTPKYAWRGKVNGVHLQPFLTDGWGHKKLLGDYSGFFNLKTKGVNTYLLRQNMNGSFSAKLQDGAVVGMDLNKLLAGEKSSLKDKTQFKLLELNGSLEEGRYHISKLNILSERFSGTGSGSVYLAEAKMNVQINTLVKQPPPGLNNLKGLQVPVNIKGSISDLQWSVDTQRLLEDPSNQAKLIKELGRFFGIEN